HHPPTSTPSQPPPSAPPLPYTTLFRSATRHTARLNRLSRFVGRADELRDLKRAVEGALSGRGGLVMVSGEPGIGKTRLAEEACVDRKSTRLNSSHGSISYAVFCL